MRPFWLSFDAHESSTVLDRGKICPHRVTAKKHNNGINYAYQDHQHDTKRESEDTRDYLYEE